MSDTTLIISTILIGYIVEVLIFKGMCKTSWKKALWYGLLINAATMPIANLIIGASNLLYGELFAITAEVVLIKYLFDKKWGRSVLTSVVANVCSVVMGYVAMMFLMIL